MPLSTVGFLWQLCCSAWQVLHDASITQASREAWREASPDKLGGGGLDSLKEAVCLYRKLHRRVRWWWDWLDCIVYFVYRQSILWLISLKPVCLSSTFSSEIRFWISLHDARKSLILKGIFNTRWNAHTPASSPASSRASHTCSAGAATADGGGRGPWGVGA